MYARQMGAISAELVETGEKRDTSGRRRVPLAQRKRLIDSYRTSGLTMAQFARREPINYSTFAGWVARSEETAVKRPIKFAQLPLPALRASDDLIDAVEVRLPDGIVLRAKRVADLVSLMKALRC